MRHDTLAEWLAWQETVHPRSIDLGLARCRAVAARLGLLEGVPKLATVAGTNGKGSCVAMLEAILLSAGHAVGAYTSPHLFRYNECVRIGGEPVSDGALMEAFARVDEARGDTSLTWFEFRTLAAVDIMRRNGVDIALLEVGLGGRLDAVNLFDADVALVSSIGVDHTEWLGSTRSQIAREKAGVFRPHRPAVCCEPEPPASMREHAGALATPFYVLRRDFDYTVREDAWDFHCGGRVSEELPHPGLAGARQHRNAAGVLMVIALLRDDTEIPSAAVVEGLRRAELAGRVQIVRGAVDHVYDVAHNEQAVAALADSLRAMPCSGRTLGVCGMLKDKDIAAMLAAMREVVDVWYVADLAGPRGAPASSILLHLNGDGTAFADIGAALAGARADASSGDRIVVFGCFDAVRRGMNAS